LLLNEHQLGDLAAARLLAATDELVVQCPHCHEQNTVLQNEPTPLMPEHLKDPHDDARFGQVSASDPQEPNEVSPNCEQPQMPDWPEGPKCDNSAGRAAAPDTAQALPTQPHSPQLQSEPPVLRRIWQPLLATWRGLFKR
jgi:hypothetical protein